MAKGMVVIDRDRCKGCELCVLACPAHVLRLAEGEFNLKGYHPVEAANAEACTGCAVCAIICPDVVFTVYKAKRESRGASVGTA
jgi:2-oxoglutarate ferredoxin oxidoreductase subunit delta